MYVANHYVRINRTVLTAGEILPEGLPEEKIAWLLKAGAIQETPGTVEAETRETDCHTSAAAPVRNDGDKQSADEEPEAGQSEEERPADEEPEEIDEEAEPEEIDVMAGIVHLEPTEEKPKAKPAKRGGRKSK